LTPLQNDHPPLRAALELINAHLFRKEKLGVYAYPGDTAEPISEDKLWVLPFQEKCIDGFVLVEANWLPGDPEARINFGFC
jgi:hypothetical protein